MDLSLIEDNPPASMALDKSWADAILPMSGLECRRSSCHQLSGGLPDEPMSNMYHRMEALRTSQQTAP